MTFELRDGRGRLKRLEVPAEPRWKPLVRARDRYYAVQRRLREEGVRHEKIRADLQAATLVDLSRLGTALADDKQPPAPTADKIEAQLANTARNVLALEVELERAGHAVIDTVEQNRADWTADARKDEAQAERDYLAAVDQLHTAVVKLSERRAVVRWVAAWPNLKGGIQPSTGALRKLPGLNGDPTPVIVVLDALRAELQDDVKAPAPTPIVEVGEHVAA